MTGIRVKIVAGAAGLLMSSSSLLALVPPALDRVPGDAAAVFVVPSLSRLGDAFRQMSEQFNLPMQGDGGPGRLLEMLEWPGVDANGSAAMAIIGEGEALDFGGSEGPVVAIIPVTDYSAFITRLGGKGGGLERVEIDGDDVFVKDLGGGFAALGPVEEIVAGFAGTAGQGKAHEARAGAAAARMLERDDMVILFNMDKLRSTLNDAMDGAAQQAEMMGQGEALAGIAAFGKGMVADSEAGALGMDFGEQGLVVNLSSQFKPGSKWASYANVKSNSGALLSRLPSKPFLLAMAMDMSSPVLKGLFKDGMAALGQDGGAAERNVILATLDNSDGFAMVIGTSPAGLMGGGLFLNSSSYVQTKDARGYLASVKQLYTEMNGKTLEGVTYQTVYKTAAADVGGKKVDEWSMRMRMDPGAENAAQAQQMQMMLFGPTGGPSGYLAPAGNGVVMTYGKTSAVMQEAMQAAAGGAGLSTDGGVAAVAGRLPSDRVFEAFIGVKGIMDMVMPFMGMVMGPVEFEVPASLSPVGVGGSATGGGMHLSLVVPADVLAMVRDLGAAMQGGMGDFDGMDGEDGAGQPRF